MKKRGFTLIELLAVIVILAIVLLIAIPIMSNTIESAKKGAFQDSTLSALKTAKDYLTYSLANIEGYELDFNGNNKAKISVSDLKLSGDRLEGFIEVEANDVVLASTNNKLLSNKDMYTYKVFIWNGSYRICNKTDIILENIEKSSEACDIEEEIEPTPVSCFTYTTIREKHAELDLLGMSRPGLPWEMFVSTIEEWIIDAKDTEDEEPTKAKWLTIIENPDNIAIKDYNNDCPKDVVIPNKINGKDVNIISNNAFKDKDITSVIISNSVLLISPNAFQNNKLTNLTIPNNVTQIQDYAFENNKLTNLIIPNNVVAIENHAFQNNQLASLTLNTTQMYLMSNNVFANNQLTSVTIPNSVRKIFDSTFKDNQLTSITLPEGLEKIGFSTFQNNQLTSITLPESLETIGASAFENNKLTSITIPKKVASIGNWSFRYNFIPQGSAIYKNSSMSKGTDSFNNNGLDGNTTITLVYVP